MLGSEAAGQLRSLVPGDSNPKRRILVSYDGSPESQRALERAAEIASTVPSEVTVISAAEPLYRNPPYTGYADPAEADAHRRLLSEATRELERRGVACRTLEPAAEPVDAIIEAARETEADLIVVGSRHRGVARRLLFGSVSGEVFVEAPCDVLVVR
jgi:nucleotide-binding universal stress UspA family protein